MTRNTRLALPGFKRGGDRPTHTWGDGDAKREEISKVVKSKLREIVEDLKSQGLKVTTRKFSNPNDVDVLVNRIQHDGLAVLQDVKCLAKLLEIVIIDERGVQIMPRFDLIKMIYDLIQESELVDKDSLVDEGAQELGLDKG